MYAVHDEGFEEDGAVVGCPFQFVDHGHRDRLDAVSLGVYGGVEDEEGSGDGER